MAYDFNFARMGSMLGQQGQQGQFDPNMFGLFGAPQSGANQFMGQPGGFGVGGNNFGASNTLGSMGQMGAPAGMDIWGKAGVGMQGASALLNGIFGFQQMGIAKDQLNFQKDAFNKNYGNQVKTTNTQLEDRQIARVAGQGSGGGAYMSVDEYMNKNRVG